LYHLFALLTVETCRELAFTTNTPQIKDDQEAVQEEVGYRDQLQDGEKVPGKDDVEAIQSEELREIEVKIHDFALNLDFCWRCL